MSGPGATPEPRTVAALAGASDLLPPRLTDAQRAAILHTGGPLLSVAGPGAGKTKVMVHRTAYLVRERGVPPVTVHETCDPPREHQT